MAALLPVIVGVAAALPGRAHAESAGPVALCIDKSSPSRAMDENLVAAISSATGRKADVYLYDGSSADDDGFPDKGFRTLLTEKCAIVLGFPTDAAQDHPALPDGTMATAPYAVTGFALVTPAANPATSLARMAKGSEIAVTYMTAPNLFFADHPNVHAHVFMSDAQALDALTRHQVQAAMIWGPSAINYLAARGQAAHFSLHPLTDPHAQWKLVGLYTTQTATAAKSFDAAISNLLHAGKLDGILSPYATVPHG